MGKYRDLRREFNNLHKQAMEVANAARELTIKQVEIVREMNALGGKLANASQEFWKETLSEIENETGKKKVQELRIDDEEFKPVPATSMDKYTTPAARTPSLNRTMTPLMYGESKRKCSLCHTNEPKPHRAKNCPNAHVIQQQKKAAATQPKPKRTRKPMTEEQRAAAVQRLVKARAMRGKKK